MRYSVVWGPARHEAPSYIGAVECARVHGAEIIGLRGGGVLNATRDGVLNPTRITVCWRESRSGLIRPCCRIEETFEPSQDPSAKKASRAWA